MCKNSTIIEIQYSGPEMYLLFYFLSVAMSKHIAQYSLSNSAKGSNDNIKIHQ